MLLLTVSSCGILQWHDTVRNRIKRIYPSRYIEYWNATDRDRSAGPARIYASGTREFWHQDHLSRLNGPAHISHDGIMRYYIYGIPKFKGQKNYVDRGT